MENSRNTSEAPANKDTSGEQITGSIEDLARESTPLVRVLAPNLRDIWFDNSDASREFRRAMQDLLKEARSIGEEMRILGE